MPKRLFNLRSRLAILIILSIVLSACLIRMKGGSDLEIISLIPHIGPRQSHLQLRFSSTLTFDRDLSVSVNSALARSREGDAAIAQLARDFLAPGFSLLAEHGMGVELNLPVVKPKQRQLEFDTPWSEWATPGELNGKPLCSEVFSTAGYNCELQARLHNAYAEFNPLMPRQISIRAVVKIHARRQSADGEWVAAPVAPGGSERLKASLVTGLARRYQEYFKQRGMHVTING